MDLDDVAKGMRLETADWIKNTSSPVVAPVNKALFGGWEDNWMAYSISKSSVHFVGFACRTPVLSALHLRVHE